MDIMVTLFDDEQILKGLCKRILRIVQQEKQKRRTARETAEKNDKKWESYPLMKLRYMFLQYHLMN